MAKRALLSLCTLSLLAFALGACPSDDDTDADTADTIGGDTTTDTSTPDTGADTTGDTGADTADPDTDTTPECTGPCDCEQGLDCVAGSCTLGAQPILCCDNAGCNANAACVTASGDPGLCGVETSPAFGDVIINELLADGANDGDANGDGDLGDAVGDEFIELVNVSSAAVDLAGFTVVESNLPVPRHTFPAGTSLPAGRALVIFGGGTAPDDTATASFVVANAADPGVPLGLALDNTGDTVRLLDADGDLVALFDYGPGAPLAALSDESYTRDPDLTGDFTPHTTAASEAIFSPGTRADGSSF